MACHSIWSAARDCEAATVVVESQAVGLVSDGHSTFVPLFPAGPVSHAMENICLSTSTAESLRFSIFQILKYRVQP
jgi:hypothetical protein